jgi:hypothetical protein
MLPTDIPDEYGCKKIFSKKLPCLDFKKMNDINVKWEMFGGTLEVVCVGGSEYI